MSLLQPMQSYYYFLSVNITLTERTRHLYVSKSTFHITCSQIVNYSILRHAIYFTPA